MYPPRERYRLIRKIADVMVHLENHITLTSLENVRMWSKTMTAIDIDSLMSDQAMAADCVVFTCASTNHILVCNSAP